MGSYLDIHPPFLHSEEKAGVLIGAHANYETTERTEKLKRREYGYRNGGIHCEVAEDM